MSKQYANLHTMAKTVNKAEKIEKNSENYEQTICTSTHHGQNVCEVSK